MTEASNELPPAESVRTQTLSATGPLELDVSVTIGSVEVWLDDLEQPKVELRHNPDAQPSWAAGVNNLLSWVNDRFGDQLGAELRGSPEEALRQSSIEQAGDRVLVRGPKTLPLRNIPLVVAIHAPTDSSLDIRAGAANVTVHGAVERADIATGSGEVTLEATCTKATIRTGTGSVQTGSLTTGLDVKTGSGGVDIAALGGSASVITGTGDARLGAVSGDVMVRSGSGNLSVAGVDVGVVELFTGSGDIRIRVAPGISAEVDLSSGSGAVSSELDVSATPPEDPVAAKIHARTGSGNATLARTVG